MAPFLFQRLGGATGTLSVQGLLQRLADGLDDLDDDEVGSFAALLRAGGYPPFLLAITAGLTRPVKDGDYSPTQVATSGTQRLGRARYSGSCDLGVLPWSARLRISNRPPPTPPGRCLPRFAFNVTRAAGVLASVFHARVTTPPSAPS